LLNSEFLIFQRKMNKIVQQALKLTAQSEIQLWTELEPQLVASASKLKKDEFINVCLHYGDNEKGTSEFWNGMSKVVMKNMSTYNAGEIMNIFEAFAHAGTQYKFPKEFCKNMVDGVNFAANKLGEALDKQEPTFRPFVKDSLTADFEEFKKKQDPFLEFTDDLNIESKTGQEKEKAKKVQEIVKDWQKEFLKFK